MKRSFALILSALLLGACASGSDKKPADGAAAAPSGNPYSLASEGIPVGSIPAAVIHDSKRNKDIELSIEYPTRNGPYPVVIFSPEYGGSRSSYVGLSAFWASHGVVVIKVSHADAGVLREVLRNRAEGRLAAAEAERARGRSRGRGKQPAATQKPATFRPDPTEEWQAQTPADWKNRAADISFVIDSLPYLVEQYPEIKERVDASKVVVGGHGYGAFTAMLIGGVKTFTNGVATSYADPRANAIVAMSPPGAGPTRGLTEESFKTLAVPTLFLTGTRDYGATEAEDPAWRKKAYDLSPPPDKRFVSIAGAGHLAFTGQTTEFGMVTEPTYPNDMGMPRNPGPGSPAYPQSQPMQRPNAVPVFSRDLSLAATVRTVSLAFFDAYLKNDAKGREFLGKMKGRGDLTVETK
jgi:predicted dienelactone hydrolase